MKKLISLTFLIVILSLSKGKQCFSQNFADKEYYLIDSLVLEELSEVDRGIIDSCLTIYHNSKEDTSKIYAIGAICENMISDDWKRYQLFQYELIKIALESQYSVVTIKQLKGELAFALNNIGLIYKYEGDITLAIEFYHKSLKIFKELKDEKGVASSYNNIGLIHEYNGKISTALEFFNKSIKIREGINDKEGLATPLSNIGLIYQRQGNIPLALKYFHKSLRVEEELNNKEGAATSYNNLGFVYQQQGDFLLALEYYTKSLNIQKEIKDKIGMVNSYSNIGTLYDDLGDLSLALEFYNKSLKVEKELNYKEGIANSYNNIGFIYQQQGDLSLALEYYYKSLKIKEEINDRDGLINSYINIGGIQMNKGALLAAEGNALKSLDLSHEIGYPDDIGSSANLLHQIYKKQGKGLKALEMYELHILMRDSVNNIETQKATIKQQTKYEYEKQKTVDDAANDKLVAIEKEAKQKQQIITGVTAGGLGLTGVFLFFVFNRLRVTRKQKLIIENQKEEVELQKTEAESQRDIANNQKLIVEIKNKEITESITYAKRIQEAILPPPRLVKEWLTESFIFYKPKDIVAGDFYWMETATYKVDNKEKTLVYFAAADCTGHGVPGAMVSVVCANALNRAVKEFGLIEPGHVLDKVTDLVIEAFEKSEEDIKDGMDIALCALDISAKKVFYSGANNPLYRITSIKEKVAPEIRTETNETHQLIEYKATKQPVGQYDHRVNFNTIEIQLEPGDAIYVFSDGFPDQFGGVKGKKYKYSSFRKSLLANFHEPMETQKQLLTQEFDAWKGDLEQIDDVCVIGVKINGVEKKNFTIRELEVLVYLQEGLPSKLIADKMNISKHTVDTYRRRLLAKTGTYNSTELINYCIKKEII